MNFGPAPLCLDFSIFGTQCENREFYHQAVTVLKRCKALREVDIYYCAYMKDLISHALKSSAGLKKLKIEGKTVSVKNFKNLKIWQGLQSLELVSTEIENVTLLKVAKIKTLKVLKMKNCNQIDNFRRTEISKDFIRALNENCKQFEVLDIEFLDDVDVQEIAKLKSLKSFKFSFGCLNAEQIKALAHCDKLETIDLCFSDKDSSKLAFELNNLFLKHKPSLKHIKISNNSKQNQSNISFLDNLTLCENLETIVAHLDGFIII